MYECFIFFVIEKTKILNCIGCIKIQKRYISVYRFSDEYHHQFLRSRLLIAERADMGRTPCCEEMGLRKGPWTPEEDFILTSYIQQHGHGNWRALPRLAGKSRVYMVRTYGACVELHTQVMRYSISSGSELSLACSKFKLFGDEILRLLME